MVGRGSVTTGIGHDDMGFSKAFFSVWLSCFALIIHAPFHFLIPFL